MPPGTQVVRWLALVAGVLATPDVVAATDNVDRCADAYELTQSVGRAGRPLEARTNARICVAACPPRLASDCATWERRLTAQIPSFVVHARGADGALLEVEVLVDGVPATLTETGSIEAEPGPHRLLLRHSGKVVEARVELAAGFRDRPVEVTMAEGPPAPIATASPPRPALPEPLAQRDSAAAWRWVFGGVGLATIATGGAISISGEVLADQLRGSCKPHCTQAQADEVVQRWIVGGVVMGAGGAILLGTLLLPNLFSSRSPNHPASATSLSLGPGRLDLEVAF